jgi:hypothetical protein
MKKLLAIVTLCALMATPIAAQNQRLTSKMLYHNGPVLTGTKSFYLIFYGCWADTCGNMGDSRTINLLFNFLINYGASPYAQINSTYTDASGQPATSFFALGGLIMDNSYSRGAELKLSDMTGLINEKINSFELPQDPNGIYVIFSSADIESPETGFCNPSVPPHHRVGIVNGALVNYVFLGHPFRCPSVAGPQFSPTGPTPNNTYAGDVLVSNLVHAVNGLVTNPRGNGWFDRYGFENADKCQDALGRPLFGETYLTANGARANVRFGDRDYLIRQNWVNDRKARCAMSR